MDPIKALRNLRTENNIPPSQKSNAVVLATKNIDLVKAQKGIIKSLAHLDQLEILENIEDKSEYSKFPSANLGTAGMVIFLQSENKNEFGNKKLQLQQELREVEIQVERLTKLLSSEFAKKAPKDVVAKERDKLSAYQVSTEKLREQIDHLK